MRSFCDLKENKISGGYVRYFGCGNSITGIHIYLPVRFFFSASKPFLSPDLEVGVAGGRAGTMVRGCRVRSGLVGASGPSGEGGAGPAHVDHVGVSVVGVDPSQAATPATGQQSAQHL